MLLTSIRNVHVVVSTVLLWFAFTIVLPMLGLDVPDYIAGHMQNLGINGPHEGYRYGTGEPMYDKPMLLGRAVFVLPLSLLFSYSIVSTRYALWVAVTSLLLSAPAFSFVLRDYDQYEKEELISNLALAYAVGFAFIVYAAICRLLIRRFRRATDENLSKQFNL